MFAPAGGNTLPEPPHPPPPRLFLTVAKENTVEPLERKKKERPREWVGGRVGGGAGEKKEEKMRQWVTRILLEETLWQGTARQLIAMTSERPGRL